MSAGERRRRRPDLPRRLSFAEMDAIDPEAWARRLGLVGDGEDLETLEARVFADLLRDLRTQGAEPVGVRQVNPTVTLIEEADSERENG